MDVNLTSGGGLACGASEDAAVGGAGGAAIVAERDRTAGGGVEVNVGVGTAGADGAGGASVGEDACFEEAFAQVGGAGVGGGGEDEHGAGAIFVKIAGAGAINAVADDESASAADGKIRRVGAVVSQPQLADSNIAGIRISGEILIATSGIVVKVRLVEIERVTTRVNIMEFAHLKRLAVAIPGNVPGAVIPEDDGGQRAVDVLVDVVVRGDET